MDHLNHGDHDEHDGEGPVHDAYYACCDTISESRAQTMAGVLAKARAIQAEARDVRGEACGYHGTMAADWVRDVVDALVRLNGGAA